VQPHDFIERLGEVAAIPTPLSNDGKMKGRRTTQLRRVEVLMDDRVSPIVQSVERGFPSRIRGMMALDFHPKGDSQSPEVGADTARLGVLTVQLPVQCEFSPNNWLQRPGCQGIRQMIDAFGMEVSAEPLKLGRKENGIGSIDLLSCITPSPVTSSDGGMGLGHFVESIRAANRPFLIRDRCHGNALALNVIAPTIISGRAHAA
jgi:hypothetical protein